MDPETFRTAKILIVDDEAAMVRLLELLLENAGYTDLRSTTDPREVLERCGHVPQYELPDVTHARIRDFFATP